MKNIEWIDKHIKIEPPKRTKKITGTRFATILGLNPWSTPFEMWCAITKTYEKPFEDTIYTLAGKIIEPKQAEYMKRSYAMLLTSPSDVWGKDYFSKTWGDFFPKHKHLGGMWDYLLTDEKGNAKAVLEMKTTKRAEDWKDDIPEYYALQAALYAHLLGIDDVIMVASFLEEKDYDNPEQFSPNISNTIIRDFKLSERYPNFTEKVDRVKKWWNDYVDTGVSPDYDEKKDADILEALRTNILPPTNDINQLIHEAEQLKVELDKNAVEISAKEKRYKELNDMIKKYALSQFGEDDIKVKLMGTKYKWTVSRIETKSIDKEALAADGLLDKYSKIAESYKMIVK